MPCRNGLKVVELVKVESFVLLSFPAKGIGIIDRRRPESIDFKRFWMPVEDPVFSGDQVRHDDSITFYESVNVESTRRIKSIDCRMNVFCLFKKD